MPKKTVFYHKNINRFWKCKTQNFAKKIELVICTTSLSSSGDEWKIPFSFLDGFMGGSPDTNQRHHFIIYLIVVETVALMPHHTSWIHPFIPCALFCH